LLCVVLTLAVSAASAADLKLLDITSTLNGTYILVIAEGGISIRPATIVPVNPNPPPIPGTLISSFVASKETVARGEAVTFSWVTQGATQVKLDYFDVPVTGSQIVTVNETSTFVLMATDSQAHIETQQRRVVVSDIPPPPPQPGKRVLTILRETQDLTPALATLELELRTSPKIKGKHSLTLLDPDGVDQDNKPSPRVAAIRAALGTASLPGVVIEDGAGHVLFAGACPSTSAGVLALLAKYGG
jgi:hypothetical protein